MSLQGGGLAGGISGKEEESSRYDLRHHILAFDFDGVICASDGESSYSSVIAATKRWPKECFIHDEDTFKEVSRLISALRPIIETGYENMLLVRLALEQMQKNKEGLLPLKEEELLRLWSAEGRDALTLRFNANKEELISFFGHTRDELIAQDANKWLALNRVYAPVKDAILTHFNPSSSSSSSYSSSSSSSSSSSAFPSDYFIITTKQKRFVESILQFNGIPPPPDDRIFDLDHVIKGKTNVLRHLLEQHSSTTIHFVEDRFETLEAVVATPGLERVELYLVDWGYNTAEQRAKAASHPRISLLGTYYILYTLQYYL